MSTAKFTTVDYPESDGRPMGETDEHRDAMIRNIELLKLHYEGQKVYVTGDLLLYYQQGDPKKFIVPDLFIVKGKSPIKRRTYRLWVEGIAPQLVIETTSRKTKKKDLQVKPGIYSRIGVREYFLYDPTCDYLDPPLQGNRLVEGVYHPISEEPTGGLYSLELELELRYEDGLLEFYKRGTSDRLLSHEELKQLESEALQSAEAEIERLRAELESVRKKNLS